MSNTISVVPRSELEQQERDLYEHFLVKQREMDEAKSAWGQVYHQLRELQQEQAFREKVDAEIERRMQELKDNKNLNNATP